MDITDVLRIALEGEHKMVYPGCPPLSIPKLYDQGYHWASTDVIHQMHLDLFSLAEQDKHDFDVGDFNMYSWVVPDACLFFGDDMYVQRDSPLLTGLQGYAQDWGCFAVRAEAVKKATEDNMNHFQARDSVPVVYDMEYLYPGADFDERVVDDVVLFPQNMGKMVFTPDQLRALKTQQFKRKEVAEQHISFEDIRAGGDFLPPIWQIYDGDVVQALAARVYEFFKGSPAAIQTCMHPRLPEGSAEQPELRLINVGPLIARYPLRMDSTLDSMGILAVKD